MIEDIAEYISITVDNIDKIIQYLQSYQERSREQDIAMQKLEDYEEQVRKSKKCDEKGKKIKRLKSRLEEYQEYVEINHKEIERLNNIINEFEKLLKEEKTRTRYSNDVERFTAYDYMLKRLQELKGDGSND